MSREDRKDPIWPHETEHFVQKLVVAVPVGTVFAGDEFGRVFGAWRDCVLLPPAHNPGIWHDDAVPAQCGRLRDDLINVADISCGAGKVRTSRTAP